MVNILRNASFIRHLFMLGFVCAMALCLSMTYPAFAADDAAASGQEALSSKEAAASAESAENAAASSKMSDQQKEASDLKKDVASNTDGADSSSASAAAEGKGAASGDTKTSAAAIKGTTSGSSSAYSSATSANEPQAQKSTEEDKTFAKDKKAEKASVEYRAHVANVGWQSGVKDGAQAGTTGRSLSMEALRIKLSGVAGGISYQAHVANIGWQSWVGNDAIAGTTGRALGIEAIKISLTGEAAEFYDVYYRVHSANLGWLGWARNGEAAGSVGGGLSVQAVEIKLVEKGSSFAGYGSSSAFSEVMISYVGHVANVGWQSTVSDGATSGTTGRSLALEALNFKNASTQTNGAVVGQAYVEHRGWQSEVTNGTIGTTGKSLPMQALKLHLTGDLANKYDIYYRTHVSNVGWMGWASNGASSGSLGAGQHIEAVQIRLVAKGSGAPGSTANFYRGSGLNYQAHSQDYGWMNPVSEGQTAGTVGKSKRLEAIDISLGDQKYSGSIKYQTHVSNIGWMDWVSDGSTAGTTGRSQAIEALKIELSGDIAGHFDVYYRVQSQNFGWLDWAKNGEIAGTTGCSLRAEAIQIRLISKGAAAPGSTAHPSYILSYSYKTNVRNSGWQGNRTSGAVSGTTGKGLPIDQMVVSLSGSNIGGSLQYSVSSNGGWQNYVNADNVAGVSGKQIEGIRIKLTGNMASNFDVWYRVHSKNFGWMGWTKNGASAGTSRIGYRAEAIQIEILPKGSQSPGSTTRPYTESVYSNQAVKQGDGTYVWYDGSGNVNRSAAINKILSTAKSLLGVPYVWLGVYPKDGGMDCASFTWYLYKQLGIDIGFETYDQMYSGKAIGSIADAKPGDLILMYNGGWPNYNPSLYEHVVLYAGNGMIYEEPTFGGHCQYVSLFSKGASNIRIRRIIAD